jgi:hypothetical protein
MPRINYVQNYYYSSILIAASLFELIFDSDDYWHDGLEYSEPWGLKLAREFEEPGPVGL